LDQNRSPLPRLRRALCHQTTPQLRTATEPEVIADLLFELEAARWLLQDPRFEVEYETFHARQGGPDFSVAYRVNTHFNVEVRRIRTRAVGQERVRKLVETLTDKARQMPPSAINLLVVSDGAAAGTDLAAAGASLRQLAESKADDYFVNCGYKNAAEFLKHFRQLSGVLLKADDSQLWLNSLAKHPLPKDLALALGRLSRLQLETHSWS
jgi:hypothetical protein